MKSKTLQWLHGIRVSEDEDTPNSFIFSKLPKKSGGEVIEWWLRAADLLEQKGEAERGERRAESHLGILVDNRLLGWL